jgi:hypothetical protein
MAYPKYLGKAATSENYYVNNQHNGLIYFSHVLSEGIRLKYTHQLFYFSEYRVNKQIEGVWERRAAKNILTSNKGKIRYIKL